MNTRTISSSEKFLRTTLAIIGFPLSLAHLAIVKKDRMKHKPTGQFVNVGNHNLHVNVTGQGKPTVILEAGMAGCSIDWCFVQPEISKNATVLSYDRAGFGWSPNSLEIPTCENYVDDLRLLLSKLNLKPPYVLVGHSYGGLMMRLFASKYPDEVSGLILVDSAHENRYLLDRMSEERKLQIHKASRQIKKGYLLAPLGIPRMMKLFVGTKKLPTRELNIVKALGYQAKSFKAAYLEYMNSFESGKQLQSAGSLPREMPVTVLSAGKQNEEWKKDQDFLAQLTNRTKQIHVDSWHAIQIHEPEIVIKSIQDMLENTI
ncbi:alpha/beta fold hydrolase [Paenibacillus sp. KN14-4R]|uniref:alpha/beta fold hydrolase n=1 Tax=Paenibacillus sp. KN14-4R TaxID=3445773 RepID=UPI003FA120BA